MRRPELAVMNGGSKHADKAPKVEIHMMSQVTNIYFLHICLYTPTRSSSPIHSESLDFFSDCHQAKGRLGQKEVGCLRDCLFFIQFKSAHCRLKTVSISYNNCSSSINMRILTSVCNMTRMQFSSLQFPIQRR